MSPSTGAGIIGAIAELRDGLASVIRQLPFWDDIERVAIVATSPLRSLARAALRVPSLRRADWLLDIQLLEKRQPVVLVVSLAYALWRGSLRFTHGHIGSDHTIYPFFAAISSYNPFLGCVCAVLFGITDFFQKLIDDDIYYGGAGGDHLRATFSYVVAYSSLVVMGIGPGIILRIVRHTVGDAIARMLFRRTAAAADGAVAGGNGRMWRIFSRARADGQIELTVAEEIPWGNWQPREGPMTWGEAQARLAALGATGNYAVPPPSTTPSQQTPPPVNLASPKTQSMLLDLSSRNLLADATKWRNPDLQPPLTADERRLMGSLYTQGLLRPEAADKLNATLATSRQQLDLLQGLSDRGLLTDRDSFRRTDLDPPLTKEERAVLVSLRGQGLLGDRGAEEIRTLLARGQPPDPSLVPPADTGDQDFGGFVAMLAGIAAAAVTAVLLERYVAGLLEMFAFYGFRKYPDVTCWASELDALKQAAPDAGVGAAVGGAGTTVADAGKGRGGRRGPGPSPRVQPPPVRPDDPLVQQATNLNNEINERQAWLDKLQRDRDAFVATHSWESDYDTRRRALEADIASETQRLGDLRDQLDKLGVSPDPAGLGTYDYAQRYFPDDADNRRHALDLAEQRIREIGATQRDNLVRVFERTAHEDLGDLKRLVDEGLVSPDVLENRAASLRQLREHLDSLGYVDDKGQFHGNISSPSINIDSLNSRIADVVRSLGWPGVPSQALLQSGRFDNADPDHPNKFGLGAIQKLVGSQMGEVPVVYGLTDALIDTRRGFANVGSLGLGGALDSVIQNGGNIKPWDVLTGMGNLVTFGGLEGATQGYEDYWAHGTHDGGWTDQAAALLHALGTGAAHVANNTILPFTAVRDAMDSKLSVDQRILSALGGLMQFGGGMEMLHAGSSFLSDRAVKGATRLLGADAAGAEGAANTLGKIGGDINGGPVMRYIQDPVARGTFVRNLLRDAGVREDLVMRMGYDTVGARASRLGETFLESGKPAYGVVYGASFDEGVTSVRSTALHELEHVQQFDQLQTQAALDGPKAGWFDQKGRLTAAANRDMELEVRMSELDRNLSDLRTEMKRAGIPPGTPVDEWTSPRALQIKQEIDDAKSAVNKLAKGNPLSADIGVAKEGMPASVRARIEYGNAFENRFTQIGFDPETPQNKLIHLDQVSSTLNLADQTSFRGGRMPVIDFLAVDPAAGAGDVKNFVSVCGSQNPSYLVETKLKALMDAPFSPPPAAGQPMTSTQKLIQFFGYGDSPQAFANRSELWVPLPQETAAREALENLVYNKTTGAYDFSKFQQYADSMTAMGKSPAQILDALKNKIRGK